MMAKLRADAAADTAAAVINSNLLLISFFIFYVDILSCNLLDDMIRLKRIIEKDPTLVNSVDEIVINIRL